MELKFINFKLSEILKGFRLGDVGRLEYYLVVVWGIVWWRSLEIWD